MLDDCEKSGKEITWSHDYNERIHKIYRGHRDANIIENKYIEQVTKECIQLQSFKVESGTI